MRTIPFESTSFDDAVERYGLDGMERPALDQVRLVKTHVVRDGDFCIDEDEEADDGDDRFRGAWLFLAGLTVNGALTSAEMDSGPVVGVRGQLRAQRCWLTGMHVVVWGKLIVERLLVTESRHGSLKVSGAASAPLVIVHGHRTELARALSDGVLCESLSDAAAVVDPSCLKNGRADLVALWNRAAEDAPLLRAASAAAREARVDELFVRAKMLVEDWVMHGKVVLVASVDLDDFADKVAKALERFRNRADPAASLGEWLLDRPEVEDVIADDSALVAYRGSDREA